MKYPYSSYNTPLPGYGTSLVDRINLYLHFRRYFKMIADRWLLMLIFSVIGTGIGVWIAVTTPNKYESYSVLMIAPKVRGGGLAPDVADDLQKFSDTQVQLMMSGQVINKVYSKLQEGRDNTNKLIKPKIEASAGKGSTFVMKVATTNFNYAQQFSIAWAQEFMEFKKQQRQTALGASEAALQRDALLYEQKLERARTALEDFKKKNNIANILDAGVLSQKRLDDAKGQMSSLATERKLFENASADQIASGGLPGMEKLQGSDRAPARASTPPDGDSRFDSQNRAELGNQYQDIKMDLSRIQAWIDEKSATLKPKHPYMMQLRRELEFRNKDLAASLGLVEEMRKARVKALELREASFQPLIQELTDEVFNSTSIQNEYIRLQEDEKIYKDNLDVLRKQLANILSSNGDEEQFQQVEVGGGSPEPTGPNRPYLIFAGVILGLLAGIGAMYLLHRLDDRLEQPEQIEEQLEEPIMGQLPEVDKKHYKEGYLLLNRMKTHTMFAESLRGVRSALLLSPEGSSKRLLAVTSAVPGDGKTTFTANFAITLANSGNRTLLVDADLRRGNVHGYFEQPLEGGLAEVLQGRLPMKDAIRETGINNLFFLRAGERPPNPSELLIGPSTKDFIRDLRAEFDYVIFDCPPLTAIDDTFSIAAFLDGLFFVVRAGKTSIRFAKLGINTIRQRGAPILGLIVNGVPIDNPYYYYTTYYYASYYHRPLTPEEPVYADRKKAEPGAPAVESREVTPEAPGRSGAEAKKGSGDSHGNGGHKPS
jgi:capsular exopolysaccharide synthesis family protein